MMLLMLCTSYRTINSVAGSHQFNKGLVSDGTKCAENHLCMGYSCVHVSTLYARGCPVSPITNTSCSGNGVSFYVPPV